MSFEKQGIAMVGSSTEQPVPAGDTKADKTMQTQRLIAIFVGILLAIALGGVLHLMQGIILPFMVALFLSYLLEPIVRLLSHLRVPLTLGVVVALCVAFALLGLMGTLFYTSVQTFVENYGRYEPKVRTLVMTITSHLAVLPPEWQIADLLKYLTPAAVAKAVLSSLGSFVTFLGHLLLSWLFTVFILIGRQRLPRRIQHVFHEEQAQRIIQVMQRITSQIQTYLGTKALVSLVTAVFINLALSLIGVEFAQLWAALALMLNFIPNAGSVVAAIPPILMAILQFDTLAPAFWVLSSFVVINLGFSLVEPRLIGESLNLSPLLVVISLVFWGWLWGIMGLVLAVPIMATIKIICENLPAMRTVSMLMGGK